eukprot:Platyproteum_vivax@DN2679_c0_g1_i1.p2
MMKVSGRSVFLCFVTYLFMGVFGYLTWGHGTMHNIMDNYSSEFVDQWLVAVAFVGMALAVVFSYPMNIFPTKFALEMMLFFKHPHLLTNCVSITIGCCTVIASLVLAIAIPDIARVFSFVGSSAGSCTCYIFPGVFYVVLLPGGLFHYKKWHVWAFILLGVFVAVLGTALSIAS